jgi:hypothetical protein
MGILSAPLSKTATWPIAVGAEGIAAAQFARCGFDVLVQAGRDKPWYDLVVTKGGNLLKVSVKPSDNGEWPLASGYTRKVAETHGMRVDCRSAVEMWRAGYGSRTVCCLVQFAGVDLHELPRIYLASPDEIAAVMHRISERTGCCTLQEMYEWAGVDGAGAVEALPDAWHFSRARVQELLLGKGNGALITASSSKTVVAAAPVRELALTV